ncbi:MAG: RAD52 family DNA repair protein [Rhizobiaceae bacterium]|nr:RAD52 family DNA repair protein [Rhizobiaceae bacterium]
MPFDLKQERKLRAKLRDRFVRKRQAGDREISYLEGWHVIAEANRIFGFDGWDRETQESRCVYTKQNGNRFSAAYVVKVRVSVYAGDRQIVRDGSAAAEATSESPGSAHEIAIKAAETDATKRALVTFGSPFGLFLYCRAQHRGLSVEARAIGKCRPRRPDSNDVTKIELVPKSE